MQYVLVIVIVLAAGLPALLLPAVLRDVVTGPFSGEESRSLWLIGGLAVGTATSLWLRRSRRMRFLTTLLHELSHMTIGLLLGTSPRSLSADEKAGLFQYELRGRMAQVRMFFITVAPYWFSPLLAAPVVLALFVPSAPEGWRLGVLAWLFAVCLVLPLAEIHTRQPDLRRYQVAPPIVASLWMWGGLAALVLTWLRSGSLAAAFALYPESWSSVVDVLGGG